MCAMNILTITASQILHMHNSYTCTTTVTYCVMLHQYWFIRLGEAAHTWNIDRRTDGQCDS